MNSNTFLSFSDYIKYCTLIGLGASSSTFLGLCINSDISFSEILQSSIIKKVIDLKIPPLNLLI